MQTEFGPRDAQRHRNLERIARVLDIPVVRRDLRNADAATAPPRNWRVMRWVTSGAAAAVVVVVLGLTFGRLPAVSAATILQDLAVALGRSVAIDIEGIDFGNAAIDGEILIERPATGNEKRYAELHVLMRADNPEWNDLDGVLVMCATPQRHWKYCRGTGGEGTSTAKRVTPTDYFTDSAAWEEFARQPLNDFDAMPERLRFSCNGSRTVYRLFAQQRSVTQALLRYLLRLTDGGSADALATELRVGASQVTVTPTGNGRYVLTARGFTRLGDFALDAPAGPEWGRLIPRVVYEIAYDPDRELIVAGTLRMPEDARDQSVVLMTDTTVLGWPRTADALLEHLRERAIDVEVDAAAGAVWNIKITGYPFPLDTTGIDWMRSYVRQLRANLTLEVTYDAPTRSIVSAVFHGLGADGSRVALRTGDVQIGPERLDPARWVGAVGERN